jgi:radical SAM superfamily enzyme YgiQ (UPF0313 family)
MLDLNIILFKILSPSPKEWLILNKDFEENLFYSTEEQFPYLLENIYKKIQNVNFIGFSILKQNVHFSFALARKIREKFPQKQIIFGGPQVLFLEWQGKLTKDYSWVIGEGEIPLCKFLKGDDKNIYRFDEIDDLDSLDFLNFSPLALNTCSNSIPLLSSRGCPQSCKFCSERKLYKRFRYHSPEYIADEIKYLKDKHGMNNFVFCDSLINYKNEWLERLCSLIISKNLNIKWEAQMRVDKNLSLELAKLMKESGCYNLFVGLESGSDKVLKNMLKGFSASIALDFFKTLHRAGLQFEISLIFGYPDEEEKDYKETLDFIIKNKKLIPKIAQANPFVDYLGEFTDKNFPSEEAKTRTNIFLKMLEQEKIKYTKSFINNLIYAN